MHYLYVITNVTNNKVYIGQSCKENDRWRQHRYFAKSDKPIQYIHHAMKKYGIDNFTYQVVAMTITQDDADKTEEQLIIQYDSRNKDKGYNISSGGDTAWNRGLPKEQQPMYGKKQSDYQKKRVSEVHTGTEKPHTIEWSEKMSKIMSGRKKDEAWKFKIAKSSIGKHNKFSQNIELKIVRLWNKNVPVKELSVMFDCAPGTIRNIVKRHS